MGSPNYDPSVLVMLPMKAVVRVLPKKLWLIFMGMKQKNVLELHNLKLFHPIIQFMGYGHLMKPFYIEIRNF